MVVALTILLGIAFIDRSAISLVADPIKADLQLNDTQLSLLVGVSLSLFQILTSIPAGILVDRFNRKNLIMAGALFWSCTTASCGLATNFVQLFLGRMGVGFGEGVLTPASFSLIRDTMPPESRGKAFGIYGMGAYIGGASALLIGGGIVLWAQNHGPIIVPLLGLIKPWQLVFLVIGLASIPFALLLLPAVEPARRAVSAQAARSTTSYMDVFRFIGREHRHFVPVILFSIFFAMLSAGYAAWGPTVAHRNYDIPLSRVGFMMGTIVIVAPAIGLFVVGSLLDRMTRKGRKDGAAIISLAIICLAAFPEIAASLMPTETLFWICYAWLMVIAGAVPPIIQTLLARMTPSQLSGKLMALYGLIQVVGGAMVGPLLIGLASDRIFSGSKSLAYAIAANSAVFVGLIVLSAIWMVRTTGDLPLDHEESPDGVPAH